MIIIDTSNNEFILSVNDTKDNEIQEKIKKIFDDLYKMSSAPGVELINESNNLMLPNFIIGDYGTFTIGWINKDTCCLHDSVGHLKMACCEHGLTLLMVE